MNPRPYTVITSRTAKDHMGMARLLLNETQQGILIQQQKIQQQQMQNQQIAQQDQVTERQNQHERSMQNDKLMGTAMLK